ncbi:hypothetical protein GNZ12_40475 [Paraburkholderia sp. 1N]|uniref:Uncharacterized protein n=1 Tax=Paraburkholderia solitsugae TaxID=2675748 RepID=A0ABX2C641_9BURK|nr:hypothetical protein [Paraburkholderia solitsugae]NPT47460.1 hypothetical protein [Paraburkholderia solitsugae]
MVKIMLKNVNPRHLHLLTSSARLASHYRGGTPPRKLYHDVGLPRVSDGKEVVPAAEFSDAPKQFRKLQRLPERKAMENEILREVVVKS